jgi:uncharacterized membrane protein
MLSSSFGLATLTQVHRAADLKEVNSMTDEEKRRRFWKIVIAAAVLWMFVIPIIAMAGFAFMHYRHEKAMPSTKPAPNLIGL